MTRTTLCISILGLFFTSAAGAVDWLEDGESDAAAPQSPIEPPSAAGPDATGNWVNPNTGVIGTFTSNQSFVDVNGRNCREYSVDATIAGEMQQIFGVACLGADGRWQESSTSYEPLSQQTRSHAYPTPPPAPTYDDQWTRDYRGYPNAGWNRWYAYPTIGLSAAYCVNGFCFGGNTGYPGYRYPFYPGYSPFWYPYGLSFNYYGHKHRKYYKHHKYYKHRNHYRTRHHKYKRHSRHYRHDRRGHHRYKHHRRNRHRR